MNEVKREMSLIKRWLRCGFREPQTMHTCGSCWFRQLRPFGTAQTYCCTNGESGLAGRWVGENSDACEEWRTK